MTAVGDRSLGGTWAAEGQLVARGVGEWQVYILWAVENGVPPEPVEVDRVMTDKFLPESSELEATEECT